MDFRIKDILNKLEQSEVAKIIDENTLSCIFNPEGEIIFISKALVQAIDINKDSIKDYHINDLFPPQLNGNALDFWSPLKKDQDWQGTFSVPSSENVHKKLDASISVIKAHQVSSVLYLATFRANEQCHTFKDYINKDEAFKWFFKQSPIPKGLLDLEHFHYVEVNRSWENYMGIKRKNAIGQTPKRLKIHKLFDEDFIAEVHEAPYGHISSSPIKFLKDKEPKEALICFDKIALQGKAYLLVNLIDFSARLKFQTELRDITKSTEKKKRAILKLSGLVGGDLHFVFKEITQLCAEVLKIERISNWKFDANDVALTCVSAYSINSNHVTSDYELSMDVMPEYFHVLLKNKILLINDVLENKLTKNIAKDYLKPMGIAASLDVVIPGSKKPYGIVCFENLGSKKNWSAEDEEFASSIANIISLAVECQKRSHVEVELHKSNEKLSILNAELKSLKSNLEQENSYLREEIDLVFNYEEMVYGSKSFSQVLTDVEQVAATNATVLLLGESGTGKELLARAIHNISPRKSKPLIKVNCAAIPRELLESELFGHKKGSFTGAINDKLGKFQLANGGTLFLDEIGELPLEMQPKLLRAIQESEVEQIGGTTTQKVDIRIIAATNRNLETEVREKRFREDLYFRINVFPIVIPPLRDRVEDIPILIEHFVNKYTKLYNKKITFISQATKHNLQTYSWPGNVRELENLIERAVILSNDNVLMIPNFKSSPREALISTTVLSLEDVQRIHIKKILDKCNWKIDGVGGASDLLQIKPSTLRDRMKKLGIEKTS